ncbi:MAG: M15 family metallopeptidase [Woeseia sp.]
MLSDQQRQLHQELGIPPDYGSTGQPPFFADATELVDVGPNLLGRMQQLTPAAARQWTAMVQAAAGEGILLLLVSGFRSFDYQAELIRSKLGNGQPIADVLRVNAAPGYSQHHSGRAVDIATPGSRPLTDAFEESQAFVWLTENGSEFGFSMSYPRDNACGFVYEPWHWSM